ncbi:MAG TPA: choice-of-anchor tandem repeat GloVer-containing protein [Stenomitos sp.]
MKSNYVIAISLVPFLGLFATSQVNAFNLDKNKSLFSQNNFEKFIFISKKFINSNYRITPKSHIRKAQGVSYEVVYDFYKKARNGGPISNGKMHLFGDSFYGISREGGGSNYGSIYKFNPTSRGLTVVHKIIWAVFPIQFEKDSLGNFYGATSGYPKYPANLFKYSPKEGYQTLYQSPSGNTYDYDVNSMIANRRGIFFGMPFENSTIFNQSSYSSNLTTFYKFEPGTSFKLYARGNKGQIYGVAQKATDQGTIFSLSLSRQLTILHKFNGTDGSYPYSLIRDRANNLYGLTEKGGANNGGTVFKLSADGVLTTLYSFENGSRARSLIRDSANNLYGDLLYGDLNDSSGVQSIFQIAADGTFTLLYTLAKKDKPSSISFAYKGDLYGTFPAYGYPPHDCFGLYPVDDKKQCGGIFKLKISSTAPLRQHSSLPILEAPEE